MEPGQERRGFALPATIQGGRRRGFHVLAEFFLDEALINLPHLCVLTDRAGGLREVLFMSIVDDLVENLVERNAIRLNGTLSITLVNGGLSIKGTVLSTLRDQRKGKDLLNVNIPVDARVKVGDLVAPVPHIP